MSRPGVLLDIDGTLLDTNHLHTLAWWRALRRCGRTFPMQHIHRLIGMGGDKLVPELAGEPVTGAEDAYAEEFARLHDHVTLLPGVHRLAEALHGSGLATVLASSSRAEDLEHFREVLDIDRWIEGSTSSGDAEQSKPDSEIFDVAIDRYDLDRARSLVVGDTVWDAEAARRAGLGFVAVTTGGTTAAELADHGAVRVYDDLDELAADLHRGPFVPLLAAVGG